MRIALFSAALLASSLASAATPIGGLYSSLFGGYSYLPDNISKIRHDFRFNRASFNNGYNAGGRFGFQSGHMRYEGEVTYTTASASSYNADAFPLPFQLTRNRTHFRHSRGRTQAGFGMANVYHDFPEMVPCISPFLGAGLGYGWVETSLTRHRDALLDNRQVLAFIANPLFRDLDRGRHIKASGGGFAYQGTAGLTFNFQENWALNVAYRYVATTRIRDLGKTFQGHLGSVGVVYRYNEYNYK